jgi:phosphoribosylformimino-5-aminoimidazole carboxamide ribotide isomerase
MKVIPAVDIKGGKCVQLVGGKPGTERIQIDDVVGEARRWQELGAEMLHIVDLDSALGTGNNESLIEMIVADLAIPVQVGEASGPRRRSTGFSSSAVSAS